MKNMKLKDFKTYIVNQATPNGNAVSVDDFAKDGMSEIFYPKTFKIGNDSYSWHMSKAPTKGRHLSNHYEFWVEGKAFKELFGSHSYKMATGTLNKAKLSKMISALHKYYTAN